MPCRVSIIIPTLNRPDDLQKTLLSIEKQTVLPEEVILIDQSPDERSKEVLDAFRARIGSSIGRVEYLFQEEKSSAKARNRGILAARGDILSFLDDDVELFEDYFERVLVYFSAHPEVGALSGNVLVEPPTGWKWSLRRFLYGFFLVSNFKGRMTPSGFGYPVYERPILEEMDVEMLPGCNMNFRVAVMEGALFDDWFTGYSYREDVELSYRISRKTRVRMIPDAKLYHHYSPVERQASRVKKEMEVRNCYYVFRKFRGRNPIACLLFCYSVAGLIAIDFLEFIIHRDKKHFEVFKVNLQASFSLAGKSRELGS